MMNREEIDISLQKIAYQKSTAFCYQDYIKCPTGVCPMCSSDDLMRISEDSSGPEYGVDWLIEEMLQKELSPVNLEDEFESSIRDCYPEDTTVGWMTFDTVTLMKEQDPISWRCALSDYESQEESEENIISFDNGSTYYRVYDLEKWIHENSD